MPLTRKQTEEEGRAAALELLFAVGLSTLCRDRQHPTKEEMEAVRVFVNEITKDAWGEAVL